MLPGMQSRLLSVTLAHDDSSLQQSLNDPPPSPLNDPLYLLHRSQETLEFMDVTLPIMLRQGFYPNLVELRIDCPGWLPSVRTYICAFPRLVTLTVEFGIKLTPDGALAVFACNQWNIAEQRRLGTWTSLCEVQGSLEDLFLLGLTCPVQELAIDLFVAGLREGDECSRNLTHAWRQVLGHARPSRIVLYVNDSDWISGNDGFELLSETPELVSLESLDLTVRVGYAMGSNPDMLGEINALDMLWVLANTFITPVELSVTFDWTKWSALACNFAARCPQHTEKNTDFPREHLDAVDMEGHVRRFVHEHTRSVRYCHVGPEGWRREATYFQAEVSDEEHAAVI